jgi:hypothetical protein
VKARPGSREPQEAAAEPKKGVRPAPRKQVGEVLVAEWGRQRRRWAGRPGVAPDHGTAGLLAGAADAQSTVPALPFGHPQMPIPAPITECRFQGW